MTGQGQLVLQTNSCQTIRVGRGAQGSISSRSWSHLLWWVSNALAHLPSFWWGQHSVQRAPLLTNGEQVRGGGGGRMILIMNPTHF